MATHRFPAIKRRRSGEPARILREGRRGPHCQSRSSGLLYCQSRSARCASPIACPQACPGCIPALRHTARAICDEVQNSLGRVLGDDLGDNQSEVVVAKGEPEVGRGAVLCFFVDSRAGIGGQANADRGAVEVTWSSRLKSLLCAFDNLPHRGRITANRTMDGNAKKRPVTMRMDILSAASTERIRRSGERSSLTRRCKAPLSPSVTEQKRPLELEWPFLFLESVAVTPVKASPPGSPVRRGFPA